jgi:hypothetical protein
MNQVAVYIGRGKACAPSGGERQESVLWIFLRTIKVDNNEGSILLINNFQYDTIE